jgi:dTDP-4-amino-4,6-dideoxygalactose transaminase
MFGLESVEPRVANGTAALEQRPAFLGARRVELATARGALRLLAEFLAPRTVWLPSYLCGVIVDVLAPLRIPLRFYPVDDRLAVVEEHWLDDVAAGEMILFIDYFGFNNWTEMGGEAHRRGAWVVEDACQAMLNTRFCEYSHYVIFSPRKFIGVPDGGVLLPCGDAALPERDLSAAPREWWRRAFAASRLRSEFDRYGGDRRWYEWFQITERDAPQSPTRMSELSSSILTDAVDYAAHALKRAENYQCLANAFPREALFPTLTPGVAPLGFPVVLDHRSRVLRSLYAAAIYPAIHWSIDGVVPTEFSSSHQLASRIATLPCDQRYSEADMERMATIARNEIDA